MGSRSNGQLRPDQRLAALSQRRAAARSASGGTLVLGSKGGNRGAYRARGVVAVLKVVEGGTGAHGLDLYCSPENLQSSVTVARRHWQRYRSRLAKRTVRLDAHKSGEHVSNQKREGGGHELPGDVAGVDGFVGLVLSSMLMRLWMILACTRGVRRCARL